MFTRFKDSPEVVKTDLNDMTFSGRYHLNTPGQGTDLPFVNDPTIRLQKWGANLQHNSFEVNDELRGCTRNLNRDHIEQNMYKKNNITQHSEFDVNYTKFTTFTRHDDQALLFKTKSTINQRTHILHENPQSHILFNNQVLSRNR
jgi:hypothetical protein